MTSLTLTDEIMRPCERCGVRYDYRKSMSSLKLTFCGILCEIAALGFSLSSFERDKA